MRAGRLDRTIDLQSRTLSTDGDATNKSWATQDSPWAQKIVPGSGAERFVGGQFISEATQAYRVRYRTDVDPTWRVKDGDELWRVVHVGEGDARPRRTDTIIQVKRFDPNDDDD